MSPGNRLPTSKSGPSARGNLSCWTPCNHPQGPLEQWWAPIENIQKPIENLTSKQGIWTTYCIQKSIHAFLVFQIGCLFQYLYRNATGLKFWIRQAHEVEKDRQTDPQKKPGPLRGRKFAWTTSRRWNKQMFQLTKADKFRWKKWQNTTTTNNQQHDVRFGIGRLWWSSFVRPLSSSPFGQLWQTRCRHKETNGDGKC